MNKINVYLDYKIENLSNYHGNSFPPLIYKYLLQHKNINAYNLNNKNLPNLDCIIIINGGSHWTYKDLRINNFHKYQIIKWLYPKLKRYFFFIGIIFGFNRVGIYKRHVYPNKSYEKHISLLIKKNPGVKVIHRLDGIYQMIGKVYGYDKTIKSINQKSDLTIYQSKFSKRVWEEGTNTLFGKTTKLEPKYSKIINNGVDLSIFNTKAKKHNFGVKFPILNVSASPSPKKGLYKILELAECLKGNDDFHFYLIGNQIDDPFCGADIDTFKNVTYLGQVNSRHQLVEYYFGAKIFMFPSEDDCSPNVILEAMACGLPILTINSGGIPEIIYHGKLKGGIFLDEENPVMSLNTLIKFYDQYSSDAKIIVERKFNIENTAHDYIEEIKNLTLKEIS